MRVRVKVKPNQPETKILQGGEELVVAVAAQPDKGKANQELLKFLKRHFKANSVELISGASSRKKVVQVYL